MASKCITCGVDHSCQGRDDYFTIPSLIVRRMTPSVMLCEDLQTTSVAVASRHSQPRAPLACQIRPHYLSSAQPPPPRCAPSFIRTIDAHRADAAPLDWNRAGCSVDAHQYQSSDPPPPGTGASCKSGALSGLVSLFACVPRGARVLFMLPPCRSFCK